MFSPCTQDGMTSLGSMCDDTRVLLTDRATVFAVQAFRQRSSHVSIGAAHIRFSIHCLPPCKLPRCDPKLCLGMTLPLKLKTHVAHHSPVPQAKTPVSVIFRGLIDFLLEITGEARAL